MTMLIQFWRYCVVNEGFYGKMHVETCQDTRADSKPVAEGGGAVGAVPPPSRNKIEILLPLFCKSKPTKFALSDIKIFL